MASSSSSSITRFLEESSPGTIASGGPQVWRVVDGGLVQSTNSDHDDELRNDRGKGESTLVSGTVGGSYNVNLSHKTHDDFLAGLLCDTWAEVGTDGVVEVADLTFNATTHTLASATSDLPLLEKGQWFQISGANTAANDGVYKASDDTAPTVDAIVVDTEVKDCTTDATETATDFSSSRLKQSNDTMVSYTIERELSEDSIFLTWKGCYPSSLSIQYSLDAKTKMSLAFIGTETEEFNNTTQFPGIASEVDATDTPYFSSVTGTSVLMDGLSMGDSCLESLSVEINANLRERRCISSGLAPSSVGSDPFTVTCSAEVYFGSTASATLYGKKMTDVSLTFSICVVDSLGNAFAITVPKAKITTADITSGSIGSDVMMSLTFEASTDTAFASQVMIDRLGSVA